MHSVPPALKRDRAGDDPSDGLEMTRMMGLEMTHVTEMEMTHVTEL